MAKFVDISFGGLKSEPEVISATMRSFVKRAEYSIPPKPYPMDPIGSAACKPILVRPSAIGQCGEDKLSPLLTTSRRVAYAGAIDLAMITIMLDATNAITAADRNLGDASLDASLLASLTLEKSRSHKSTTKAPIYLVSTCTNE
jgi:hypothetical protein